MLHTNVPFVFLVTTPAEQVNKSSTFPLINEHMILMIRVYPLDTL